MLKVYSQNPKLGGPNFEIEHYRKKSNTLDMKGTKELDNQVNKLDLVFAFASPQIFQQQPDSKEKVIQLLNHREEFKVIDRKLQVRI